MRFSIRVRAAIVGLVLSVVAVACLAAILPTAAAGAEATSARFTYTGDVQTWTVPAGVTSVVAYVQGAQGGGSYGGFGGGVRATLAVSPGSQLQVTAGGRGAPGVGGFNDGGGSTFGTGSIGTGQGGGGASDIRNTTVSGATRLVVAGGGGGGAGGPVFGMGGSAGGRPAESGENGTGIHTGGGAGGDTAAGTGGGSFAGSGNGGVGGNGGFTAGGGGGGWFGGGGGGGDSSGGSPAGGGAGSSQVASTVTDVTFVAGARTGDGQVELSWGPADVGGPVTPGTFSYTGGPQVYQVPAGVSTVDAEVVGGQGGAATSTPGFGAVVKATIPVVPGQVLAVIVGGHGGPAEACGALTCGDPGPGNSIGGFNGGGTSTFAGAGAGRGSGGGGATDLRPGSWRAGARAIVAAGGGGAATNGGKGGDAAGSTGGSGAPGDGSWMGGGGGQPAAGGKGGGNYAGDGRAAQGGAGGFSAGSGGGGWFGGGGGGGDSFGGSPGGGGAGSSFVDPAAANAVFAAGSAAGDGRAAVTPGTPASLPTPVPPTPAPPTPGPAPADSVIVTPDLKLVQFLQMPLAACLRSVRPLLIGFKKDERALAACGFLVGASNPDPPADLQGPRWERFVSGTEFRGFVHLPSFKVTCTAGLVTKVEQQGTFGVSPGWTPILFPTRPGRLVYEKAEPYRGDPGFNQSTPSISGSGQASVIISARGAARIATAARLGQYAILQYDAPYIWTATHVKVGCDGEVIAVTGHSGIPRVAAYVDDRQVAITTQSTDLPGFIKAGGRRPSPAGQGKLAPGCDLLPVFYRGRGASPVVAPTCAEVVASGGFTRVA